MNLPTCSSLQGMLSASGTDVALPVCLPEELAPPAYVRHDAAVQAARRGMTVHAAAKQLW